MNRLISFVADPDQRRVRRQWAALGLAAFCLAAATGAISCSRNASDSSKQTKPPVAAVPVLVSEAVEKEMAVQVRAIGNVQPYSKVTIRSQITGQLLQAHFQEGQEVRKGDLLCTIDPRPAQATLAQGQGQSGARRGAVGKCAHRIRPREKTVRFGFDLAR
jgi:multidrug efflux system membrane fusion protein